MAAERAPPPKVSTPPIYYRHVPKNILLVLLSCITLPLSSGLVALSLIYATLRPAPKPLSPPDGAAGRKTILVTGISMTKGLSIARLLAQHTPHRIIGADVSLISPGRFSRSLSAFFKLTPPDGSDAEPYIDSLLHVIRAEKVDLWISCSSVIAAVEDGQVVRLAEQAMGPGFKAIQFKEDVIERLHEKDRFVDYIRSLDLPVPESHRCTSANEVLDVLLAGRGTKKVVGRHFIMKPIGVDDRARNNMMTLLPFSSVQKTKEYVKSLEVSASNPFQLQQYISGAEYCTHALVIRGKVVAFTSCPSLELLMHYEALPADSKLSQEMLAFTEKVAQDGGAEFTGHLSFDFLADGDANDVKLYPIECNPRAHTAVALFADTPQIASAYLSALSSDASLALQDLVVPRTPTRSYYWIGHDLVSFLLLPLLDLLWGVGSYDAVTEGLGKFYTHLVYWRDGTFVAWDPVPLLVLYHVYWPMQFLYSMVTGQGWSRINVSTTKVFHS